ncbi:hypothetical protein BsWGS_22343 [Bradybaena similaris]
MSRLPPLPTIQEIIRIYGLTARKKLSQNFILDMNLTHKIVRSAGRLDDGIVIEVGPGPGGITRAILNTGASKVIVIEKDRRFLPSLEVLAEASKHRLEVIHGDILDFNLKSVLPEEYKKAWESTPPNIHLIGNLPFSISTPLIIQWLHCMSKMSNAWSFGRTPCTLTFQKEVAERIIAPPKSEYRCRLSIVCQYLCDVKLKFTIPGQAFVPPPKVDVGVVQFVPLKEPRINQPFPLVEKVSRHLFHYPNKYLTKSIETLFPLEREDLCCEIMELTQLKPEIRPFELAVVDVRKLCDAYAKIVEREPDIFTYDFRSKFNAMKRKDRKNVISDIENKILYHDLDIEQDTSDSTVNFQN